MKILVAINGMATGGAEKLVADTTPIFQQSGIEVDVLLLNGSETPLLQKLKSTSDGEIISLGRRSVYDVRNVFSLIKYMRKYDVIHVHLFPALYFVAIAKLLSLSKVKLVYTEHSTNNRRRINLFFKVTDKLIYKLYHKVITISPEVDDQLRAHLKSSAQKFVVIPNGILFDSFRKAVPHPKTNFCNIDDRILVQVSSFRYPKDQPTVIRALQYLDNNVKLLLVGEGPNLTECRLLTKELGLEDRVLFLGIRMDIPQILRTADIVILSSVYEGLSLSSLEGMACGRPFIASDAPGLTSVVGGAGVLFPIGDHQKLAHEINKLLSNKGLYREVADLCIERASDYDILKMVKRYSEVYRHLTF